MNMDVDIDAGDALKGLTKLEDQVREEAPEAVRDSAEDARRRARDQLTRQGSVATGTGIESLGVKVLDEETVAVIGRSYLELLDTGTQPHTPEVNNRLITWAEQEGWALHDIVEYIEQEGTQPMPRSASWREIAFDPVAKSLATETVKHVKREIDI